MTADSIPTFDPREFRSALGSFATGVTVVTTRDSAGVPIGLTANSFNSVSLEPPMVLWSLALNALSLPAFSEAEHWVVHILGADQEPLSKRFASRGTDKFAGLEYDSGLGGAPLLRGCAARFECRTAFKYEGGDHLIFVGKVERFERSGAAPLLFHAGSYALALRKEQEMEAPDAQLTGDFNKDSLSYLLGRGHAYFHRQLRESLQSIGISNEEYFVLAAILAHENIPTGELQSLVGYLLSDNLASVLNTLESRNYIARGPSPDGEVTCRLAPAGQEVTLHMFAEGKGHESQITERFGAENTFVLKSLLRKLLTTIPARETPPSR